MTDLTGMKFGKLTVIEQSENIPGDSHSRWRCKCECGKEEIIPGRSLLHGRRSGCRKCVSIRSNFKDLTGERFGRLTVVCRADNDADGNTYWECKCDCGKETIVSGHALRRGKSKSCGCLVSDVQRDRMTKHGALSASAKPEIRKLYFVWSSMIDRCESEWCDAYELYGKRGVRVCDEWKQSFESFRDWSLENGYQIGLSIDRIDNDGNYCPENCRWTNRYVQNNNKRDNNYITYNGETHTLKEWADIKGINYNTLSGRINRYGWSVEDALELKTWEAYHGGKKETA